MSASALAGNEPLIPVAPELFVRDIDASLRFYTEDLGFTALRREPYFAVVALGDAHVLLALPYDELPGVREWLASGPRGVGVSVRIMVDGVDVMYRRALASGTRVVQHIGDREYELRDFTIADPDGFFLRFAAPVATGRGTKP